jgi:hypothetical protein
LEKAYPFAEEHGLASDADRIRDMNINWDRPYTSSVRRGLIIDLLAQKGLLPAFKETNWPYGLGERGKAEEKRYLKLKSEYEHYVKGNDEAESNEAAPTSDAKYDEFALESHLRDFLAKNPDKIEKTLQLYATPDYEGVEYPVDHGWIDILAIDAQGGFVVVELKLSRGRQRALGQLLYYMGWVDQHLGTPSNPRCRGIIIAKKITDALVVSVTRVPGVKLYQYKMSYSTELVDAGTVISATGA